MAEIEESLRVKEKILNESVAFWEEKIEQALEAHNDASSRFDNEDIDKAEDGLKTLYARAMFERKESLKLEKEISRFCAWQAFRKLKQGQREEE